MSSLRVLIVDRHPVFREAAARLLASDPQIQVVGSVPSCPEALDQAAALLPDVVVAGMDLISDQTRTAVEQLKSLPWGPQVILLSFHDQAPYREFAYSAGADAFLSKAEVDSKLLPLLHRLLVA